jgi:2,3,4,5-tetrahydropyridine-2-carboxylate N-succinyltransferase
MYTIHQTVIQEAWENRAMLNDRDVKETIRFIIDELDQGHVRVAEPSGNEWIVHEWVKKAVILYFIISEVKVIELDPFEFYDKIPLKKGFKDLGVRVVPHAVGSCAQVGKNVHLSGGVGIGGVLEPIQAAPVIIEDNCFIGSRSIVVEGVRIEKEAVLGANVVITQSTKIIDITGKNPVEYKGLVPPRSVVIPGTYHKKFPAGEFGVSCALIIGQRKESTDKKTSLNQVLRDFNVPV